MNRRDLLRLLGTILIIALAVVLVGRVDRTRDREESGIVRDAVFNAALTCYAVEGGYPDNIDYLREYYQLAYNEDRYQVTYEYNGSNLSPDIYVTEIGAE